MFEKEKYDAYLDEHISNVKKAYKILVDNKVFEKNPKTKEIIDEHDKSKYSKEEYDAYGEYFYGDKNEDEFNKAWLHHQHNNPHHWQYWVLKEDDSKDSIALMMPEEYVQEMICDWLSFSIKQGNLNEIHKWYNENKSKQILHKKTKELVEEYLEKIKGIDEFPEEAKKIFNLEE